MKQNYQNLKKGKNSTNNPVNMRLETDYKQKANIIKTATNFEKIRSLSHKN